MKLLKVLYFPVIVLAIFAALYSIQVFLPSKPEVKSSQKISTVEDLTQYQEDYWKIEVARQINELRTSNNLSQVEYNFTLERSAEAKANVLKSEQFFGHTLKDGTRFEKFIADEKYYRYFLGENLASGFKTPEETIIGWLNSPSHKRLMLTKEIDTVGVGIEANFKINNENRGILVVLHVAGGQSVPPGPYIDTTTTFK